MIEVTADKYSRDTLNDKDTVSGQTVTKNVYAYIPLALTAYKLNPNNQSEAVNVSDQSFRDKFFCHEVWKFQDSEGKDCVIGLINPALTGVTDYNQLHAGLRKGKLRKHKNGTEYIVLNDGGLNTKPFCKFSDTNTKVWAYTNYIKVFCNLQSAFYLPTNYFRVTMTWSHAGGTEQQVEWTLMFGTDFQQTPMLGAGKSENQYPAILDIGEIGELYEGDQITLKIEANNDECIRDGGINYVNHQSNWRTATVLGAMRFIQVYWFDNRDSQGNHWSPTSATNPTSGTPYAMLISEDMYDLSSLGVGAGGVLAELFNSGPVSPMTIDDTQKLQGCQGLAEDAYDGTIADLPRGWIYGVPEEGINGATLVYIEIINDAHTSLQYAYNPYTPIEYNIIMKITGTWDETFQNYVISITASLTGTRPNAPISVTTELWRNMGSHGRKLAEYSGTIPTNSSSVVMTRTDQAGAYTTDADILKTYNTVCAGATHIEEGNWAGSIIPPR